jgi:2-polyprenyl-6-methoxyphenol hydroxylase-like FAD-dependent oxidoreductase
VRRRFRGTPPGQPRARAAGGSTDSAAAAAWIAREFDGWAPELTALITALITDGDTTPVLRPINTLPIGHRWDRVPGVTLLGDAAHLSPPNGEGANLAMYDGAELGKAIAAHPDDVEAALTEYEQALFPRSTEAATEATRDFELCYDDNAPHSLINMFTAHTQSGAGPTPSSTPTAVDHVRQPGVVELGEVDRDTRAGPGRDH